jgi:hypothetical protein
MGDIVEAIAELISRVWLELKHWFRVNVWEVPPSELFGYLRTVATYVFLSLLFLGGFRLIADSRYRRVNQNKRN